MQDASSSSTGSKVFEVAMVAFFLSIGGAIASFTPMFVMLSTVWETERSVAVHRVFAVNFTIVYAASIIFLAQFVVIALRVTKKKLRKTTLQAMEFVYLGFGAVGVLTIVSLLSELD